MNVKYDVYKTPSEEGKESYHARVVPAGTVTTEDLAENIEFSTTLTKGDVVAVLSSLGYLIGKSLSEGKRVHIDGLGFFQMIVASKQVEDPEKMRGEYVRFKSIDFRSDKKMKKNMGKIKFTRIQKKNHSFHQTDENIEEKLSDYFRDNVYITRSAFQEMFGFTRITAQRRINDLILKGILKREGKSNFPIYIPIV